MSGYLLDIHVIAELTSDEPQAGVVAFLEEQDDLWLPSLAILDLEYGVQLLPQGRRRDQLYAFLSSIVAAYHDRILPLDRKAAESSARLRARARRVGRTIALSDALVAGIAHVNDLTLVTRNVSDFHFTEVPVANPWNVQ